MACNPTWMSPAYKKATATPRAPPGARTLAKPTRQPAPVAINRKFDHAWPLEIAATQTRGQAATAEALLVGAYPIAAVYWCGAKERVFRLACNWIERWLDASGWKPTLRLHIIASARIDDPECIQLFIVPRDSRYPNSQRMVGTVGSLEVLGEFVFCTDDELKMLMNGQINHTTAVEILASVEPRGQREVLARICP